MSSDNQQQQHPVNQAETGDTTSSSSATPSYAAYRSQAVAILTKLDELEAMIPGYQQAHKNGRDLIRPYIGVPAPFVRQAMSALDDSPQLGIGIIDSETARERQAYATELGVVRDRLIIISGNVDFSVNSALATVGAAAQKIYGAVRLLARDPRSTTAAVYAKAMKFSRGIVRKKGTSPQQSPQTPQQSPTPAPQPDSAPQHELKQAA